MPTPQYRWLTLVAGGLLVAAGVLTAPATAGADPMSDFMCSAGSTAPEFCLATPPRPTPHKNEPDQPKYPYQNCAQARNAGKTPLYRWDYGYSPALDPDGDGIACPYQST
ncbi:excalibur calcium-binding domain-containing protein [Aldersonia kunmingensis]|uniref:excalibur calcium-binding domain-containing protein n=1 Tax=Aldersonia kunmingensis TaxID=408066 RepID=UPI0008364B7E|nr:excalibur calcium-binding domain-containing protein [Aldersonia kunmingensis]